MTLNELHAGKLFLVDKPLDWTSFDVVNKLRWHVKRAFNIKSIKVGHAGTLDPKATGLLIICVGAATKGLARFQNLGKTYTGTLKLGATTPSSDTETAEDAQFATAAITPAAILQAALSLHGEQWQVPPLYSAVKQDGKRLYTWARAGEKTEVKPRKVYISEFEIESVALPSVSFRVSCSKGTYIRSLVRDLGSALDNGAYLTALSRTRIGPYHLKDALSVEQLLATLAPQEPKGHLES